MMKYVLIIMAMMGSVYGANNLVSEGASDLFMSQNSGVPSSMGVYGQINSAQNSNALKTFIDFDEQVKESLKNGTLQGNKNINALYFYQDVSFSKNDIRALAVLFPNVHTINLKEAF